MRKPLLRLSAVLPLLLLACGSNPPEPTKTADDAKKQDTPAKAEVAAPVETTYDLTPVAEPPDVVGVFSWKSPAAMIQAFSGCSTLPGDIMSNAVEVEARRLLKKMSPKIDPRALSATISFDAPVLGIAALEPRAKNPNAFVAVSVGLASLEKAKAAAESAGPLTELQPGLFRIPSPSTQTCVIAASAGSTPARLVCGPREKDVTTLAPYLTRTMPTQALSATDMHLELRFVPAEARFGSMLKAQLPGLPVIAQAELSIGDPLFDKAIVDAATNLGDEVAAIVSDADKLLIDASVDPATCLKASAALTMRSKTSWLAGLMGDRPERAGPPPAIFWRAPKESASVFYGRGSDPKKFTPILRTLKQLAEGGLAKLGVGADADRRAIAELLDIPMSKDIATISAQGEYGPASKDAKRTIQQEADALAEGYLGWTMIGYEEGSEPVAKYLKKFVDVYGRKGLQKQAQQALGPDAYKFMPKVKIGAGPAALGAGSLDLSIKVEKLPAQLLQIKNTTQKDLVDLELHVLVMQDGPSRTWIAFGPGKPDALVKRLLAAKTGAPDSGTIASRADLEPMRRGTFMGAGYMTMAPMVRLSKGSGNILSMRRDPAAERVLGALAGLPHKGEAPMFLTTSTTGTDSIKGEVAVSLSKDVLEDLGWLFKTVGR